MTLTLTHAPIPPSPGPPSPPSPRPPCPAERRSPPSSRPTPPSGDRAALSEAGPPGRPSRAPVAVPETRQPAVPAAADRPPAQWRGARRLSPGVAGSTAMGAGSRPQRAQRHVEGPCVEAAGGQVHMGRREGGPAGSARRTLPSISRGQRSARASPPGPAVPTAPAEQPRGKAPGPAAPRGASWQRCPEPGVREGLGRHRPVSGKKLLPWQEQPVRPAKQDGRAHGHRPGDAGTASPRE